MKKPEVSIRASPTLVSGTECPIDIDVTAHDETKVDFMRARIVGEQGWTIGSVSSSTSSRGGPATWSISAWPTASRARCSGCRPGLPRRVDAARVRELVTGPRGVLVALDPGRGPYR